MCSNEHIAYNFKAIYILPVCFDEYVLNFL